MLKSHKWKLSTGWKRLYMSEKQLSMTFNVIFGQSINIFGLSTNNSPMGEGADTPKVPEKQYFWSKSARKSIFRPNTTGGCVVQ